jgi:menaquinone-dependent protoporphyrinogen oxidase
MRVLITFRSRYGTTEACSRMLAGQLEAETECIDLAGKGKPDVSSFDVVLIGGSVYGGKIQREVAWFCERSREPLLQRRVGLFLCCLYRGERAEAQLQAAFPSWLTGHAFARGFFGGALRYDRLSLLDRLLVRGLAHPGGDVSTVSTAAIEAMARAVNALTPGPQRGSC